MPEFAAFDQRQYRTVPVRDGYRQWAPSYEATVEDGMDLALLERVATVAWGSLDHVIDLGCGTGRTATWLRGRGVRAIDGVDLTPEMLEVARARGVHDRLTEGDVRATSLPGGSYDAAVCALVDEHLPALDPLYREARRLVRPGGTVVLVGFHPFFIMATGMPTHFDGSDGEPVALETHVHLFEEHTAAAGASDLVLAELHEGVVDDGWIERKPSWAAHRDWPISFAMVWRAGP